MSNAKNSVNKSAGARRKSFKLNFLPKAVEFVSVSSRAMTTTGTGDAVLAVLGLKTSVFVSSNDFGAFSDAKSASRQAAGDVAAPWDTSLVELIDSFDKFCNTVSMLEMLGDEYRRACIGGEWARVNFDSTRQDAIR